MSIEDFDFEILEKGKKIYKSDRDFAVDYDELLQLFSLYISLDPDYHYNSSYLFDKIVNFSYDFNGYYRKLQIIEEATQKWISSIETNTGKIIENIVVIFDDVLQFKTPFDRTKLVKLPTLDIVKANNIRITCKLEHTEIIDCIKVYLKNGIDAAVTDIVNYLNAFLQKVCKNSKLDCEGKS